MMNSIFGTLVLPHMELLYFILEVSKAVFQNMKQSHSLMNMVMKKIMMFGKAIEIISV